MFRKVILVLTIILLGVVFTPSASASGDLIKPTSRFYFLQTWGEEVRLLLTFSKDNKIDYLLTLTEKRVDEISSYPSSSVLQRYDSNVNKLSRIAEQVENKEDAVEKIKGANLRQQEILAKVYAKVPDEAKGAIVNAQEQSSKHVAQTIQNVQGSDNAQNFTNQVEQIIRIEKAGQVEQVPMEGSPNANPGEFTPKAINGPNEIKGILPSNQSGDSGGQMQPAEPVQINQQGSQY
ncbi:MAG TPA: DUF5667 domain-containing protein [Patescibacteria group bacterium]|nr:DUF5667 domain-containing protein [Patescibacteria group bacterium]